MGTVCDVEPKADESVDGLGARNLAIAVTATRSYITLKIREFASGYFEEGLFMVRVKRVWLLTTL